MNLLQELPIPPEGVLVKEGKGTTIKEEELPSLYTALRGGSAHGRMVFVAPPKAPVSPEHSLNELDMLKAGAGKVARAAWGYMQGVLEDALGDDELRKDHFSTPRSLEVKSPRN